MGLTEQSSKKANLRTMVMLIGSLSLVFLLGILLGRKLDRSAPIVATGITTKLQTPESQADLQPELALSPQSAIKSTKHRVLERPMGENGVAEIAASAAPSVVNIETEPIVQSKGQQSNSPFPINPFAKANPPLAPRLFDPRRRRPLASGSGLIVRSDGYVVTNNHLVPAGCQLKVTLNDQRSFKAKLVGRDIFTDLAVLKIDADHLPVMPFGDSKMVRPGEWAIAIGNPLGFDHTVTLGIVSAINRSLADLNTHVDLIQTDAAINPGNSGGPLLNIDGQVIGITSAIRSDAQNIGFAIPVDVVEQVSNALIKSGKIVRPYLGVFMKDLDSRVIASLNLSKDSHGVLILRVVAGGPAERAGMVSGDFIEKCDGIEVSSVKEVRRLVKDHVPGDILPFVVKRDGRSEDKKLLIGNYPNEE